jgi:hypothetical protein
VVGRWSQIKTLACVLVGKIVLNPSQMIRSFDFSRYVAFVMHIDIHYVYIHTKSNVSQKTKTSYNLGGVWLEELKFNKHCSTFVLFDKKFPILD